MHRVNKNNVLIVGVVLGTLLFGMAAAGAQQRSANPAPGASFEEIYARALGEYEQGKIARAKKTLSVLVVEDAATLSRGEAAKVEKLDRKISNVLADFYNAALKARAEGEAGSAARGAKAEKRYAEQERMLQEAAQILRQAGATADEDALKEAIKVRQRVALERANEAFERGVEYYAQARYDLAAQTLESLKLRLDEYKKTNVAESLKFDSSREQRLAQYLGNIEDAKLNWAAAEKVIEERKIAKVQEAEAKDVLRKALADFNEAQVLFDKGSLEAAQELFQRVVDSGATLGEKKDIKVKDYLAQIGKQLEERAAKRTAAVAAIQKAEGSLQQDEWLRAKELLHAAHADRQYLNPDETKRLADVMALASEKQKAHEAQVADEISRAKLREDAVARAQDYLESVAQQEKILRDQEEAIASDYYVRAKADFEASKFESALENVKQALRHQPDHADAAYLKAEIIALMGGPLVPEVLLAQVTDRVQAELQASQTEMNLAISQGRQAFHAKEYDKAVEKLTDALEVVNYLRPYYDVRGVESQVKSMLARAQEAKTAAEKELETRKTYEGLGAIERATEEERARKEQTTIALYAKANAEFGRGQYQSAMASAEKVLERDPENAAARELRDQCRAAVRRRAWQTVYEAGTQGREDELLQLKEKLILPRGIVQYPAKEVWAEILNRGPVELPSARAVKTPKVLQLETALDKEIAGFSFDQQPLREVLAFFKQLLGATVDFNVDPAFQDQEILITLSLNNVSLGDALRAMLRPKGLTYVVSSNGYIYISDAIGVARIEAEPENLSFRQYDIADLLFRLDEQLDTDTTDTTGTTTGTTSMTSSGTTTTDTTSIGTTRGRAMDDLLVLVGQFTGPRNWDVAGVMGEGDRTEDDTTGDDTESRRGGLDLLFQPATGDGTEEGGTPEAGEGFGRVMILRQNYLMVNHVDRVHKKIEELLDMLRAQATVQVQVEARLITFTDQFFQDFGVDFTGQTADVFAFSTSSMGGGSFPNIPAAIWNYGFVPATNVTSSLATSATNLLNLSASFIGSNDAKMIIHAVKNSRHATVVSAPHITLMNAQQGDVQLVKQGTYISGYNVTDGFALPTLGTYVVSNVRLRVQPVVSWDRRYVTMNVAPTVAQGTLTSTDVVIPVRAPGGGDTGTGAPTISATATIATVVQETNSIRSSVRVPDRGTLILGGLANLSESKGEGSIPFMGHIPILNRLFSRDAIDKSKSHLLFMATPTILLQDELEP